MHLLLLNLCSFLHHALQIIQEDGAVFDSFDRSSRVEREEGSGGEWIVFYVERRECGLDNDTLRRHGMIHTYRGKGVGAVRSVNDQEKVGANMRVEE